MALELALVAALAAEAVPRRQPSTGEGLRQSHGKLATDALDAAVLAHFAEVVKPPVRPQFLNSLVARRHQVITMLVSEKNRLSSAATVAVRPRIDPHCVAGARVGRPGEPAADSPSESRMAGEGTSYAPFQAWGSSSPSPFWPTCRSWVRWIVGRSPPWWEWLPSTGTAVLRGKPYGVGAPGFVPPCTWER